jgi:copper(I)-binding protein
MMSNCRFTTAIVAAASLAMAFSAAAQVTVTNAWVRGTVAGQKATGAFMQLNSSTDASLVAVASRSAKFVEIHEMTLVGGVMKMSAIDALPLQAGKPVELRPGGSHVMLFDLAQPLKEGDTVPLTLTFVDKTGKKESVEVSASVKALTAGGSPAGHKY